MAGDDEDVFVRPIPGSEFSIRLFGKYMEHERKYGLDFVRTSTGEPENSPFEFELHMVQPRNSSVPWHVPGGSARLHSMESGFGMRKGEKINPGEEKFILDEGTALLLKRPGHRDVYFEVPVRRRTMPQVEYDADVLEMC